MDESIETVRRHYNQNAQEEWDRLTHHPFEFELTTWMMDNTSARARRFWTLAAARAATPCIMPGRAAR